MIETFIKRVLKKYEENKDKGNPPPKITVIAANYFPILWEDYRKSKYYIKPFKYEVNDESSFLEFLKERGLGEDGYILLKEVVEEREKYEKRLSKRTRDMDSGIGRILL